MPDGWVHPVAQGLIRCVSIAMEILSETLEGVLPQSVGPSKGCPCAVLSLRAVAMMVAARALGWLLLVGIGMDLVNGLMFAPPRLSRRTSNVSRPADIVI